MTESCVGWWECRARRHGLGALFPDLLSSYLTLSSVRSFAPQHVVPIAVKILAGLKAALNLPDDSDDYLLASGERGGGQQEEQQRQGGWGKGKGKNRAAAAGGPKRK